MGEWGDGGDERPGEELSLPRPAATCRGRAPSPGIDIICQAQRTTHKPSKGMFCPDRSDLQFLYPTESSSRSSEEGQGGVQSSGIWGCRKRTGLTGHPIAVVKVAITSIVHENNNNNIMQRTFPNVVGGHAKYLISTPEDIRIPFNIETTEFMMVMISYVFQRQLGVHEGKNQKVERNVGNEEII